MPGKLYSGADTEGQMGHMGKTKNKTLYPPVLSSFFTHLRFP